MSVHSKRDLLWSIAILSCLLTLGCGTGEVAFDDFLNVKNGMTIAEVEAILGTGKEVSSADVNAEFEEFYLAACDKWMKWGAKRAAFIGFQDGKVRERLFSQ